MTGHRTKPKKDRRKHPARCSPVLRPERIAGQNPAYPFGVPSPYGSGSLQRTHEPWSFCLRVSAVHTLPLRRRHSGLSHSSLRLFYHSKAQKSMGGISVISSEERASGQPSLDFPKRVEYNPSNISKAKAGSASGIECPISRNPLRVESKKEIGCVYAAPPPNLRFGLGRRAAPAGPLAHARARR